LGFGIALFAPGSRRGAVGRGRVAAAIVILLLSPAAPAAPPSLACARADGGGRSPIFATLERSRSPHLCLVVVSTRAEPRFRRSARRKPHARAALVTRRARSRARAPRRRGRQPGRSRPRHALFSSVPLSLSDVPPARRRRLHDHRRPFHDVPPRWRARLRVSRGMR